MRRKFSKGLSIVLALTMAGSLMACAGADDNTASSAATQQAESKGEGTEAAAASEEADPYGPVAEKITLHVGRSEDTGATYLDGQDSSNNYLVNHISEKLGITFEYDFSVPSDTYETKVSMAITSGEIPDVMVVNESQLRQLVAAGAIEDMSDAYNKYASDNLKAAYDTTKGISFASATFDGKLMGMPSISPGADGIPMLFVRGDWMEELNLEEPKTVEDIVNIVEKFKAEKGTTNGLIVSSKIVSKGGSNTYGIDALFARYNSYPKHFITGADGKIVYGSNTAELNCSGRNQKAGGVRCD